jgi:hypothetical protein
MSVLLYAQRTGQILKGIHVHVLPSFHYRLAYVGTYIYSIYIG